MQKPTTLQNAPKSLWHSGIRAAVEAENGCRIRAEVAYHA
jgi:hypothetical protein